jgi:predicted nucleic acid-binding protein
MNVFNRCFDDQSQMRIKLETAAVEGILALAEQGKLTMVWSFMLDYENSLNPYEERREGVQLLSGLCKDTIRPSSKLLALARDIVKGSKMKPRDAVHLASAEVGGCDYFITCDDDLISIVQRSKRRFDLKVKAINPVEFIRDEGAKYGQS